MFGFEGCKQEQFRVQKIQLLLKLIASPSRFQLGLLIEIKFLWLYLELFIIEHVYMYK